MRKGMVFVGLLALAALPACGATEFFTDETLFDARVTELLLTPGIPSNFSEFNASAANFTFIESETGVPFFGFNGVLEQNLTPGSNALALLETGSGTGIRFGVPAIGNTHAIGIHVTLSATSLLAFGTSTGSEEVSAAGYSGNVFFGIVSTVPLTGTVQLRNTVGLGSTITVKSVETAAFAGPSVPEPSTYLMFGSGLLAIALLRRRSKTGRP